MKRRNVALADWDDDRLDRDRDASKALVPIVGCPLCGGPLTETSATQPALLRHGGYGAHRVTVWRYCAPCAWQVHAVTVEARPDRR